MTNTPDKNQQEAQNRIGLIDMLNTAVRVMRLSNEGVIETSNAKTGNENYLVKIEFPEEGGVLSYYSQYQYPIKGFFYHEAVDKLDIVKKIFTIWFSRIDNLMTHHKIQTLIGFLFFKRQLQFIVSGLFDYAAWLLSSERLKPNKYCQFVREVYRTFNKINTENDPVLEKARDIICVFLEFDDAYRYRLQYAVSKLKIKRNINIPSIPFPFTPDPIINMPIIISDTTIVMEELQRILNILEEREKYDHMKMRWRVIKRLFKLIRFYPKIQNIITDFFLEFNINEANLSKEDQYHASFKESFIFE